MRELAPLRGSYRDTELLAVPHPSIGGAVIEALNILETYPSDFFNHDSVDRLQVLAEAFHIATVDHERMLAEPLFTAPTGWETLLTKEFAAEIGAGIP